MTETVAITPPPIATWVNHIVPSVFDTMTSLQAVPAPLSEMTKEVDRVTGAIGIAGENVTGAIYLHLTSELAALATAALLGMGPEETPADADMNDAVGELCNMVGGGFKSALQNHGIPCAISTPGIIRGSAFAIETSPDVRAERFQFDCSGHRLAVEIHLKLQ